LSPGSELTTKERDVWANDVNTEIARMKPVLSTVPTRSFQSSS
jgi:hypothetical protein